MLTLQDAFDFVVIMDVLYNCVMQYLLWIINL